MLAPDRAASTYARAGSRLRSHFRLLHPSSTSCLCSPIDSPDPAPRSLHTFVA
ncbi:hypothetical protein CABS01_16976 [Colletotrichum abscissum]|uniref:Uncharacterized protein n=1 Tax=Colletotrichum tamarilloi TaxID=1209934 RepID=A0ABQ9QFZ7_9PEZI|nr:uncharacterized protein CTAM01_17312 [Colletotrichum tamarilloi]XP_060400014.1 uncharacterized protein CABS01_16976 [Colletotrichum abscissum]KAK1450835.1 hypothetical protein CTAM01_17312 [Colletotrichum tamarilloi]KAK1501462.1 hypothetical protein CABS01_16976 [Colletotrichum abscissum]